MKSTPTPWTHTAKLKEAFTTEFGGGRLKTTITVPAGTLCRKLEGGSVPWVVADLSWIEDKSSILYWDADHYGIRVPEELLVDILPVK